MQAPKPRTIILRSLTRNNLSIELNLERPRASMSLRRRNARHSLSLPGMQQLDLCVQLDLEPDDVLKVLERTPQVRKYKDRILLTWLDTGEPPKPAPEPEPEPEDDLEGFEGHIDPRLAAGLNLDDFLDDDDE